MDIYFGKFVICYFTPVLKYIFYKKLLLKIRSSSENTYFGENLFLKLLTVFQGIMSTTNVFSQKVVRYDLTVTDTIVNFSGKYKRAIAVNGQILMPTLTFTEGDTAEIVAT
jgi:hypothetical protein|tara:strand:- start:328 stop:660 length:333 start_codon:yes stop_codon:yes gene_type:complete